MKKLTKEQIEMLVASGHVARMTEHYVYFKSSFINKFCTEYHAGKTAEAIYIVLYANQTLIASDRSS